MNKDPLEELFGSAFDEVPEPKPARERLSQEQAERVRTKQLQTGTPGAAAKADRAATAKPWIVVGVVALLAIVASILIVNTARGGGGADSSATSQTTSTQQRQTSTAPEPSDTPEPEETSEKPDEDQAPQVDVGDTNTLPIGPWNATSQLSQRLGQASFAIPDNVNLELTADLLNSFPESCAAMRGQWGATRLDDGSYELRKPASTCADAPELYTEVWGLLQAWVDTIKPAG